MRELALALGLVVAAASAQAQEIIDGTDPLRVLNVARDYGEAALTADGIGDPMIEGRIGAKEYRLNFYGCSESRDCGALLFSASWEQEGTNDTDMAAWNRKRRNGKAYLEKDGRATIEMNVNLRGGVTRNNLDDTFDWWRTVLKEFAREHSLKN